MLLDYLKFPVWTLWRFVANLPLAARNTRIMLGAFACTLRVGFRAARVLESKQELWSERTKGRYLWRVARRFWARWILERAEVSIEVEGLDRIDWTRPHVIVANHQSTLDILLVVATLDCGRFVAKKDVLAYPALGPAVGAGGQIVVDRKDHEQAMMAIRRGMELWPESNLVFFAEGTRSRSGSLGEFKKGAFAIAKENTLPIVPLAISGTFDALPKGSLLRLRRRSQVRMEFGEEIYPHGEVVALADYTREVIDHMLDRSPRAHAA